MWCNSKAHTITLNAAADGLIVIWLHIMLKFRLMSNNILNVYILSLNIFSTENQLNQSQWVDPEPDSPEGIRGSVTGQFPDGSRIHTGSGLAWVIFQITPDKPPYHSCWFCPQSKIKLKYVKSICPTYRQLCSSMFILTCLLLLKSWKKFCFFLPSVWNGHYHWPGVSVSVKTEIRL